MVAGQREPVHDGRDVLGDSVRRIDAGVRRETHDAGVGRQEQRRVVQGQEVGRRLRARVEHHGPRPPAIRRTQDARRAGLPGRDEEGIVRVEAAAERDGRHRAGVDARPGVAAVGGAVEAGRRIGGRARDRVERAVGRKRGRDADVRDIVRLRRFGRAVRQPAVEPGPGVARVGRAQQADIGARKGRAVGRKSRRNCQLEDRPALLDALEELPARAAVGRARNAEAAGHAAGPVSPAARERKAVRAERGGEGERAHRAAIRPAGAPGAGRSRGCARGPGIGGQRRGLADVGHGRGDRPDEEHKGEQSKKNRERRVSKRRTNRLSEVANHGLPPCRIP